MPALGRTVRRRTTDGRAWRRSETREESLQRLGRHRWTIERTMAWPAGCRRLHRRYGA
ncbi:transposase [Streptomyces sp. NPDC093089]|uniref:transposase n=1 Tax=Streptomyces sp. NPDC093089 TaxID=3366024 RepID=UPI0038197998